MQIQVLPITEVQPYGRNAKKHPDKQVVKIADSIKEFGFNQPIVVDPDMVIIVGHGRYMAAQYLGMTEVPVLVANISDDKVKAYRLADNKLNESDWDMDLVIAELKDLELPMVDLTGFSRSLLFKSEWGDDDVPAVPKVPKSKAGDIYDLGRHRIGCVDATKLEEYGGLMTNIRADMVFTDPPYNVNWHGSGKNTSNTIMNDKMNDASFREFLIATFKVTRAMIKGGAPLYVFHSPTTQNEFEAALNANGIEVKSQLIWNKPSLGLSGGAYRPKHEPFFYASVKGVVPEFYGDRTHHTVWDFQKTDAQLLSWAKKQREAEADGRTTIWTMKREPVSEYVHPTQKPVELIMYALANSSKVDDVVLDPFLGSGSTLIACEKTNRICYGSELDPQYMDVIIERYVQFTGNRQIKKNGELITW